MAEYDFRAQRLVVTSDLAEGTVVPLEKQQAHYLADVMRMAEGNEVYAFNGRDGEWRARLQRESKRAWNLEIIEQTRPQPPPPDLQYLFVPLRQARLDYMVQKATELGVGAMTPVVSDHAQVRKINHARLSANIAEAAEQCGVLHIPALADLRPLGDVLDRWPSEQPGRRLVVCDEGTTSTDPVDVLMAIRDESLAVLIGPEGGFSERELGHLRMQRWITPLPLGPRILRADTAAVAALSLVQAVCGDWRTTPPRG